MDTTPTTPDAVILPTRCAMGAHSLERATHVSEVAENILGVNRAVGERAHCFIQHTGVFFCTKSLADTIAFPKGHKWEGHPRYNWVAKEDGSSYGYLVKHAKPTPIVSAPVAEVTHA